VITQEQKKGRLSCVFFVLSFIFPVISLIIGWVGSGWKAGVISGLVTFGLFFLLGSIFAMWVQTPSWFTIMSPTIAGLVYGILPDFIPLQLDAALVAAAGAIISFALAIKHYTDMPRWILAPLLGAALYTVVGSLIPGPVDELIVGIISVGVVAIEINKHQIVSKTQELLPDSKANTD
jgi:hypothetical protein